MSHIEIQMFMYDYLQTLRFQDCLLKYLYHILFVAKIFFLRVFVLIYLFNFV